MNFDTSLHHETQAYPVTPRASWILEWPGQVVLAVSQVYWTMGVVETLTSSGIFGLVEYGEQCRRELTEEVMLVRGQLRPLERATIGALVVLDVHARDVVAEMVNDKVGVCSNIVTVGSLNQKGTSQRAIWLITVSGTTRAEGTPPNPDNTSHPDKDIRR